MVNKDYHFYMLCTVMDHDFCSEKNPLNSPNPICLCRRTCSSTRSRDSHICHAILVSRRAISADSSTVY